MVENGQNCSVKCQNEKIPLDPIYSKVFCSDCIKPSLGVKPVNIYALWQYIYLSSKSLKTSVKIRPGNGKMEIMHYYLT